MPPLGRVVDKTLHPTMEKAGIMLMCVISPNEYSAPWVG